MPIKTKISQTPEVKKPSIPSLDAYNVEVYSLSYCKFCNSAKDILKQNNCSFTEYQLDDKPIYVKTVEMLDASGTTEDYNNIFNIFDLLRKQPTILDDMALISEGSTVSSVNAELAKNLVNYFSDDHSELLPALDYFIEEQTKHEAIIKDFMEFIEVNKTGSYAPQIAVNGEYFGGHAELTNCIDKHGNLENCFFEFSKSI